MHKPLKHFLNSFGLGLKYFFEKNALLVVGITILSKFNYLATRIYLLYEWLEQYNFNTSSLLLQLYFSI